MVNYSINFVRLLLTNDARIIDVKHSAEVAYTNEMQHALKDTVWRSGCSSWYFTENGWNSTVYPYSQIDFWRRCKFVKWSDWNIEYTSKGLARLRLKRMISVLALALAAGGMWKMGLNGVGLKECRAWASVVAQGAVQNAVQLGQRMRGAIW